MMSRVRRAQGRHAALQVRRQPDPHRRAERAARHAACPSSTAATASTRSRRCRRIPFRLNSNDFHFDTEIIIQLLNAGAAHRRAADPDLLRRRDLPRERDEVRQGRRAGDAAQRRPPARACSTSAASSRSAEQDNAHYDLKLGYPSSHQFALDAVPAGRRGARHRRRARRHRARAGEEGLPRWRSSISSRATDAPTRRRRSSRRTSTTPPALRRRASTTTCCCSTSIEHLQGPRAFLERLRDAVRLLAANAGPDDAQHRVRHPAADAAVRAVQLRQGRHPRPHAHAPVHLPQPAAPARDAGFRIKEVRGVPAPFPKVLGDGVLGRAAIAVNQALIRVSQIAVLVSDLRRSPRRTPGRRFILEDSRSRSAPGLPG